MAAPDRGHTPKLQATGIRHRYPAGDRSASGVIALDGVDLDVAAGEFVSIVGPSGCGKSTLLDILAGLTAPTAGEIRMDGADPGRLLGAVGYMPQKDLLMPWRTVLDNTTIGLELAGVSRREARDRARAELQRFGLAGFEDRWPHRLSGGMRQRAALLRTFLAGREVMLLDEPFGALDALTRQDMQAWLLDIWSQDRKTIVLVTHDVDEAIRTSDRVYVMSPRPGRMVLSVEIDLPRPRPADLQLTDHYVALKRRLLEPLLGAPTELDEAR
jgi:ABC-type nitrate/sulfonate/bicarbonate transport system ATPase subunit